MAINSKRKGAAYEREVAAMLKASGYDTRRTAQYCGNTGEAADVVGLPYIHIECKHTERTDLYGWMKQAERDAQKSGNLPAVFHRKNYCGTLVIMGYDDWVKLYQAYELQRAEEERGSNANV